MINGKPYKALKYESILKEQLLINQLTQGGISIEETNNMPIPDRKILLTTLQKVEEDKKIKRMELMEKRKQQKSKRR